MLDLLNSAYNDYVAPLVSSLNTEDAQLVAEKLNEHKTALLIGGAVTAGAVAVYSASAEKHDNIELAEGYLPFFGHIIDAYKNWDRFYQYETAIAKQHPKTKSFCLSFPLGTKIVFITDPEVFKYVFRTHFDSAVKSEIVQAHMGPMFGHGIFASDGEIWKKHRKIASHMFTHRALRDYMFHVFTQTSNTLVSKLESMSLNNSNSASNDGSNNNYVNLYNMFNRLTLEAFTKVAFGVDLGCIDAAPKELKFATAFDRGHEICTMRFMNTFWKVFRALNIGVERELKYHVRIIDQFISNVIETRRVNRGKNGGNGGQKLDSKIENDLLSLFLKQDPNMTDKELRDVTMNFIIAGRDTTAQMLSWFFYNVIKNPSIEEKILDEIRTNLGESAIGANQKEFELSYETLTKFNYVENALLETLRLYPSVPHLLRYATHDIELENGQVIRKGDGVVVPTYSMGRLPWVWGDDALEFDPTRFEDASYDPSKYMAFNIQPRFCLGKQVALMEAKIIVIQLISKYRLVCKDISKVKHIFSVTNQMNGGFLVKLVPRESTVSG